MEPRRSKDVPPPHVLEKMTLRNLPASLRSETCPACGGPKAARTTVCGSCLALLPAALAKPLYRGIGMGYDRAVLAAMEFLGATEFILPESVKSRPTQQTPLRQRAMTAEVLEISSGSAICPSCARPKKAGTALCEHCLAVLAANLAPVQQRLGGEAAAKPGKATRSLIHALDPARLKIGDDEGYAEALYRAMRLLKCRVFLIPRQEEVP